jgi:hypothetical protein
MSKKKVMRNKPKSDLKELFGAWSDIKDSDSKNIRAIWRGWYKKNAKSISRTLKD